MIQDILRAAAESGALDRHVPAEIVKGALERFSAVETASVSPADGAVAFMADWKDGPKLAVMSRHEKILAPFRGEAVTGSDAAGTSIALLCPLVYGNAAALRNLIPRTAPTVLDARQSFGTGDRIGSPCQATPWHLEACAAHDVTPVAAQQSVRENHKTGRTFQSVMDDATWSVFRVGFDRPWGSDADHLKTIEDIGEAIAAGFTMFTLDPSDMIDNEADTDTDDVLGAKLEKLLGSAGAVDAFIGKYAGTAGAVDRDIVRSGAKYLAAVAHAVEAYRFLVERLGEDGFNFEMSIDETATTTTVLDHRLIATELLEKDVRLFSLAPRFPGKFEKGIDYIGNVDDFRRDLRGHVALSRELGDYRLSLHSGSDKFSVYPVFGGETDGFFHVKTAGTSFLEAVKVVAHADFDFFLEIYGLSVHTFEANAASYEISGDAAKLPAAGDITPEEAVALLDESPDMRQTLHIAFGVILSQMGERLRKTVASNEDLYREGLVSHLGRHLSLLTGRSAV